jgi:hypothetical protein
MIAICADRRTARVRTTSGYFACPVPVLSRRDQPQCPGSAVSRRHERRRVAGHRADGAPAGLEGRQGRPAGGVLPPGHRDAMMRIPSPVHPDNMVRGTSRGRSGTGDQAGRRAALPANVTPQPQQPQVLGAAQNSKAQRQGDRRRSRG